MKNTWVTIAVVILMIIVLLYTNKRTKDQYIPLLHCIDSMNNVVKDNDKIRDSVLQVLKIRNIKDSAEMSRVKESVSKIPDIIQHTKKNYNEKKSDLIALPVDEQLEFFSNRLSQKDTIR